MRRNYQLLLVFILAFCASKISAQTCQNDTTFTDVVFLVDNSGSITDAEYNSLETIILTTLSTLSANCPDSRRGVVHYGGLQGQETIIEYPLSGSGSIMNINRQFCTTRSSSNPNICSGGAGGDDLNNAIGDIMFFIDNGTLQLDTSHEFKLVILTDAFNTGPVCSGPACSVILPLTNIDMLKANYDADVTVVGISQQASADILGLYASPGGEFEANNLDQSLCGGTTDGCDGPRKYIPIEFTTPPATVASQITSLVQCQTVIIPAAVVDAGVDQDICVDRAETVTLTATPVSGTAPFTYAWSNNLGTSSTALAAPTMTTTYTVTMTDANNCEVTDQVTINGITCGPDCTDDTTFTDIVLMIDNSGSITDSEFAAFENIILTSLGGLRSKCPFSRRAIMHYGGAFGRETFVEFSLGEIPVISNITRQFCATRNSSGGCPDGGDDLNFAMGELISYIEDGTLQRNPNNNLSLVVLTDAFNIDDCATNPNCSVSLPTTNVDTLKSRYGASVTVVGISSQARPEALAISASPGGEFTAVTLLPDCQNSLDGCQLPRKYVPVEFTTPAQQVSDAIAGCVDCQAIIVPKVVADAGADQVICGNLGETATITAIPSIGLGPYSYQWSNNLGNAPTVTVAPTVTTTYFVTITDANTCENQDSVTINVIECDDCDAEAGTPLPPLETCIESGRAFISTERNTGVIRPSGFEEVFFLTNEDLIIIDYSVGGRTFTITEPGVYRIHTLIAETSNRNSPDYFDLSVIVRGESGLFVITNCIIDHDICADFDYPGRVHIVLPMTDMRCMRFENSITLCSDGVDNDGDGLIDCADPECMPLMNCLENTLIACNDLFDNDNDGLVDCLDPDCFAFRRCFERGAQCRDGIDNDGDGLIDCLDDSCADSAECIENNAFTCTDGIDNDNDGLIDCQEAVCQKFIVCAEASPEACQDGIDNDRDGLIDCADANCKDVFSEVCTPQENSAALCSDGIDNDADGLLDCDDPDCGVTIFDRSRLEQFVNTTSATCPSNSNGILEFEVPASLSTYEYSIDGGDTYSPEPIFNNLTPGNYTVAIRAAGTCLVSGAPVSISGAMCPEVCDNGIDDDGDGNADCDDDECGISRSVPAIFQDPACPSRGNGVIRLFYTNATGGVAGLEYSIDGGDTYQQAPIFRSLSGGRYDIRVRSAEGCITSEVVTLSEPSCPEVCNNGIDDDGDGQIDCADGDCVINFTAADVTTTPPTCPALDDATITVNRTGFSYRIGESGSYQAGASFSALVAGDYVVSIRNANGCTASVTVNIATVGCVEICDNGLDDDGDGLTDCDDDDCGLNSPIDEIITAATCPDNNNGIINITNSTPGIEYSIDGSTFQTSPQFTDLTPGDYTITERNMSGCILTKQVTITGAEFCPEVCDNGLDDDGDGLVDCADSDCTGGLGVETQETAATCPDNNNGIINIINAAPGIEYSIDGSTFQTAPRFTDLTPGAYTITERNTIGCILIKQVTITGAEFCPEVCDNNLDDDGDGLVDCADSDCTGGLVIETQQTAATCPDLNDGVITVSRLADDVRYSIDGGEYGTSLVFDNLPPGTYTIGVINGNGCTANRSLVLGSPPSCSEICDNGIDDDGDGLTDCDDPDCGISVLLEERVTPTTCPDNDNGRIEIISDAAGLEYRIDDGVYGTSTSFSDLAPGSYMVTARNAAGCFASKMIVVPGVDQCVEICDNDIDDDGDGLIDCDDPDCGLDATFTLVVTGECEGLANGGIQVVPSTDANYRYSLSGSAFQTDALFSGLGEGSYEITVINDTDCDTIITAVVPRDTCQMAEAAMTSIQMDLKVILEGPYNAQSKRMSTALNDGGYLPGQKPATFFGAKSPAGQPFNQAPWFYDGPEGNVSDNESGYVYHPEVVDWVLVSLRTDVSKEDELCKVAALLYSDGHIEFDAMLVPPTQGVQEYYIVVEHRNHLPIMTKSPIPLVQNTLTYDFTRSDTYTGVFGIGQRQLIDGTYAMVSGNGELIAEISSDIDINVRDLTSWLEMNGANSSYYIQDYDMNGDINIKDRILWEKNNGLFSTLLTK